jgi:hypothetical protein
MNIKTDKRKPKLKRSNTQGSSKKIPIVNNIPNDLNEVLIEDGFKTPRRSNTTINIKTDESENAEIENNYIKSIKEETASSTKSNLPVFDISFEWTEFINDYNLKLKLVEDFFSLKIRELNREFEKLSKKMSDKKQLVKFINNSLLRKQISKETTSQRKKMQKEMNSATRLAGREPYLSYITIPVGCMAIALLTM